LFKNHSKVLLMSDTAAHHLQVLDWGLLEYGEALKLQEALVSERIAGLSRDRLVLVEHPPVVTIGRSGSTKDLRVCEEALKQKGASVFRVDRGGMVTYHGPGQLVAYPIIKLREKDLHLYLQKLLNAVAAVLHSHGLSPEIGTRTPGVWAGPAKIASVGIAVRRWVSYHGIALNVNTDLNWFDIINPCGNPDEQITSMERELGRSLDMGEVKDCFIGAFCRIFEYPTRPEVRHVPKDRPPCIDSKE
jgi:lipoyl synthase